MPDTETIAAFAIGVPLLVAAFAVWARIGYLISRLGVPQTPPIPGLPAYQYCRWCHAHRWDLRFGLGDDWRCDVHRGTPWR